MKSLHRFSWIVLINIFLVIVAGSVVRMTGSGMGCPDWPKCFGYIIPPTQQSQIEWKEGKEFAEGQMIIHEESLWKSNSKFVAGENYNPQNWTKYTKHDYAIFNVFHTWTEYINRLLGALLGFVALITIVLAARKWKINKWFLGLAVIQLFLILFQAWLGKLTVDTNLNPYMITYHMIGVVVMVMVQLLLLKLIKRESSQSSITSSPGLVKAVSLVSIVVMFLQIVLGTQVRQQTDTLFKAGVPRELIADSFDSMFIIHRTFSYLVIACLAFLMIKLYRDKRFKRPLTFILVFTLFEISAGIIMYYFGMQAFAQPIHLLLSILMFGFFVEVFYRLIPRLSYNN